MKKILILLFISTLSLAQNATRKFESFKEINNTLEINTSDGLYRIQPYSEKIIETTFIPKGEIFNPDSHAVILVPKRVAYSVTENSGGLQFSTSGIVVTIQKSPFKISYSYKNKELLSEKNGYVKKDSTEVLDFNLDSSEVLYGGGARVLGMNRRGNRLQLYNRAHYGYENRSELMNFTMPLVLSSKLYAVHFDNAPIGYLDLDSKKDNTLAYETILGRKTYQVIAGDSWQDLIENYTDLTGKQPLPPRWAMGNFSSRFGYHSQAEAEKTIQKFKEDQIPVDAIILDLYWFGKDVQGTMGNLEVFRDSFPNFEKMVENFNKIGVKTITITEPFILTTSKKWQEAVDQKILATDTKGNPFTYDFYFGNTGLIDIFKPEGKNWFWNIYKELAHKGVAGIWSDLGEPEVHPSALQHATGSADEVHNIYGHRWAKLIHEGYLKDFPDQRPFILMRSGYSGSQRFGMIPWSGDVSRSWGGLSGQTEIALQMGMQGMGYMHSDLGGFAGANLDDELYSRWLQYGVFQPVFRPHAQEDVPSEPVFRSDKAKALAKKAIELRYQLLPYNYTLAFENNQKGTPLMRPLFFEEPENTNLSSVAETYFWGNDFLVSPITKAGITEQEIYFPKSSNWFDFYTSKKHTAGSTEKVAVVEDYIPIFVRGGAFIPMIETIQSTQDYSTENLQLHYFYDRSVAQSSGNLYDDNGVTPRAFEKGHYEILNFNSTNTLNSLTITVRSEKGADYTKKEKNINLVLHQVSKPKSSLINGEKVKSKWNKKEQKLVISFPFQSNQSQTITIQFSK